MKQSICDRCNAKSVYYRAYSGESLCSRCFSNSIREKVAKTISKYSMLKYRDRVAIAVSGGKDSLTLLHILRPLCYKHGNEICAITIDEGIRGYREESLDIVREFTKDLNVEHLILSYKELFGYTLDEYLHKRDEHEIRLNACSICGTFRRRAIDLAAEKVGATVIATAHNLDDFLQTFMINLFAGDVDRIGWMYPEPVEYANNMKKIKPMVEIYEHEIAFYALVNDIPFQAEECKYMHESIRSEIREFINTLEKDHAGIKYNAFRTMLKVAERVKSVSSEKHKKCIICNRDSSADICSVCRISMLIKSKMQI